MNMSNYLKQNNIMIKSLAEELGVSRQQIWIWVNAKLPTAKTIVRLSKALIALGDEKATPIFVSGLYAHNLGE